MSRISVNYGSTSVFTVVGQRDAISTSRITLPFLVRQDLWECGASLLRFGSQGSKLAGAGRLRLVGFVGFPNSRENEVSSNEEAVVSALRDFSERILQMRQRAEEILEVAEKYPNEPVLDLAVTLFWLFGQTPNAQDAAGESLGRAQDSLDRLNAREKTWARGLGLWHEKRFDAAAVVFEEITETWPQDLLALRVAEFLYYNLGQQFSGPRFLVHTGRLFERHENDPDFLAMHAFANELSGNTTAARTFAERAIELRAVNPWAQHTLEHVLLWEGNTDEAERLMEGWLDQWPTVARPIHSHNSWHVALMHLDRLEDGRAFSIFNEHVWGKTPDMVVEQLDAISFLWRAEMAGFEVAPSLWESISGHVRPICETLFMPFATAHYAYALARAGDRESVTSLLRAAVERSSRDDDEAVRVWKPVGNSIVRGAAMAGEGRFAEAASELEPVMTDMTCIGGSDAQDDLFRFAFLDALTKSGRRVDAGKYLRDRLGRKTPSALEERLLAGVA